MKLIKTSLTSSFIRCLAVALGLTCLSSYVANAHPFAANITGTNGANIVSFVMNEAGATVDLVFEDGTTNHLGVLPKGTTSFDVTTNTAIPHTSWQVICFKAGTGVPSLISSDANTNSTWANPRGFDINKNPKIGTYFGALYAGSAGPGGNAGTVFAKHLGLYVLQADENDLLGYGTNAHGTATFLPAGLGGQGPWRLRMNADNSIVVSDQSVANSGIWTFTPDLLSSTLILGPVGATPGITAGVHGRIYGTPWMSGSIAGGNLVLWLADNSMGAPSTTNCIKGPGTSPGSFNFIARFDIGAGPLPWSTPPNYAYTVGLDGLGTANLRPEFGDIGTDGKIIAGFGRGNLSNPDIQILSPSGSNLVWTSWNESGGASDPWNGINAGGGVGTEGGIRVSPDGVYLASIDINNGITFGNLTNGIPDDGSLFGIVNAPSASTPRGGGWDAADNFWVLSQVSSPSGFLRCYSLGLTTTCITSNDFSGTNGSFAFIKPGAAATVVATTPTATQNYVNNVVNPGAPIPGVFRIQLSTNTLATPVTVSLVYGGSAVSPNRVGSVTVNAGGSAYTAAPTVTLTGGGGVGATATATIAAGAVTAVNVTAAGFGYISAPGVVFTGGGGSAAAATANLAVGGANYTINTNQLPNGVTVAGNSVTFPAGVFAGSNGPNWNVDVTITPTATPVIGPTLTVALKILGGVTYSAGVPVNGTISILNTGPQLLSLAAIAGGGSMNRGIPGDYGKFTVTRLGDLQGPGNDSLTITPKSYTVTNWNYFGTAAHPLDYTGLAQTLSPVPPFGNLSSVLDGVNSVTIPAGVSTVTVVVGNPVKHTDPTQTPTNLTVLINVTNSLAIGPAGTNATSSEGYAFSVIPGNITINELDNTIGKSEVVIWSNPLTNAADSVNWTATFENMLFGSNCNVLPAVIPNYPNDQTDNSHGGTNDFIAAFGKSIADDGVPASDVMTANGWNTVLKVTVNKQKGVEAGLNLYPQGVQLFGNYALRFDMYLSLLGGASNNVPPDTSAGIAAREYVVFGVNHYGTNCNWCLDANPRAINTGSGPTNSDGVWFEIDASSGAITPADFDYFTSPAIPNTHQAVASGNGFRDQVSASATAETGIFKHPPFNAINPINGGEPVNKWVDVSVEITAQTNINLFIVRQLILSSSNSAFNGSLTNTTYGNASTLKDGSYMSGTPMLGYNDPNNSIGDPASSFAMYSNVRVVEMSPYIFIAPIAAGTLLTNTTTAISYLVPQFGSLTFTSTVLYASNPLTNKWFRGTGIAGNPGKGVPTFLVQSNSVAATNFSDSLTVVFNTGANATNYLCVASDTAGSVTSRVCSVEVVLGPTNKAFNAGSLNSLQVTGAGASALTAFQWYYNAGSSNFATATKLVNSSASRIGGATTGTLFVTNSVDGDAGFYWAAATNAVGGVIPQAAVVTVTDPPVGPSVTPASLTALWGSNVTFTVSTTGGTGPFTFHWRTNLVGAFLANNTKYSGAATASLTVSNVTRTDAQTYIGGVTNSAGGVSASATLTVLVPAPTVSSIAVSGGNTTLSITSSNPFDTASGMILQSSGVVWTGYTNNNLGVFTGPTGGPFSITVTNGGNDTMFYRLLHAN